MGHAADNGCQIVELLVVVTLEQVPVPVEGCPDRSVPEAILHSLGPPAPSVQQGRMRVPQVVEGEPVREPASGRLC